MEYEHNVFFFLVEMMDSSTFKRFTASIENILDNLEDMDFTAFGKINLQGFLLLFIPLCLFSYFLQITLKNIHYLNYQEI